MTEQSEVDVEEISLEAVGLALLNTAYKHAVHASNAPVAEQACRHVAAVVDALDAYYKTPAGMEALISQNLGGLGSPPRDLAKEHATWLKAPAYMDAEDSDDG